MLDVRGRAACTYNVDSDTLDRQSTFAVKVSSAYLSRCCPRRDCIGFEGFALEWDKPTVLVPTISPYMRSISLRPMSVLLLAHCVNKLMLGLLRMQIAVLCAFQVMGGLKQPLQRGTVSGILFEWAQI